MERQVALNHIKTGFRTSKVVAILGPRQSGKTTLARQYFKKIRGNQECYFDLEDPRDLLRLQEPLLTLEPLQNLIVIDEIQRVPELFQILRVLVDKQHNRQHYLILGSASRELIKQSSESLAGRIHYIELMPFSYPEARDLQSLWMRGGFPLSYLAKRDDDSFRWRQDYIRTFLEQDIPNLGVLIPPENLRRFWMMLAHYHGQLFNASELGNALGFSSHTIQRYLDILTHTFMMRQLYPWHENISKRQVKAKKIYFRDSGIFHALMNIANFSVLHTHPKIGASWEGFALESIIRYLQLSSQECYFWRTQAQAELDLLVIRGTERIGFEFKYSLTPNITKSMHSALQDLKLKQLYIIYPGDIPIRLAKNVQCMGLANFCK